MNLVPRCLIFGLICAAMASGQTVKVPVSEAAPNSTGTFSMILESPAGESPVALQWEMAVPSVLAIQTAGITPGTAAAATGKSLNCAPKTTGESGSAGGMRVVCILSGGVQPIGNGPVASVRYRVQAETDGAPIRVVIQKILGVYLDLKRIAIPNADAIIKVR